MPGPKGNLNGQDKSGLTSTKTQEQSPTGLSKLGCGLPAKNLIGLPWRVAFALQDDGWILRSAIVWNKPNPMPESVRDRPSSAHEMIFLLSKSPRYYYDGEAIRTPQGPEYANRKGTRPPNPKGERPDAPHTHADLNNGEPRPWSLPGGANARNVWTIATQPRPDAHFATFPDEIPRRCILAGTSEQGVCAECGAPRERVVEKRPSVGHLGNDSPDGNRRNGYGGQHEWDSYQRPGTTGWRPTCDHDADTVPATVLDPFVGSGTTVAVAQALGRRGIGLDLSTEYLDIARKRIEAIPLPLAVG